MDYMTDNDSYISYHLKTGQGLERSKGFCYNRVLLGEGNSAVSPQPNPRTGGPEDHTSTLD